MIVVEADQVDCLFYCVRFLRSRQIAFRNQPYFDILLNCQPRIKREGLEHAAELAIQKPFYNPRKLLKEGIRTLLEDAFEGRPPRSRTAP